MIFIQEFLTERREREVFRFSVLFSINLLHLLVFTLVCRFRLGRFPSLFRGLIPLLQNFVQVIRMPLIKQIRRVHASSLGKIPKKLVGRGLASFAIGTNRMAIHALELGQVLAFHHLCFSLHGKFVTLGMQEGGSEMPGLPLKRL